MTIEKMVYEITPEQHELIVCLLNKGFDNEGGWGIDHNNVVDLISELETINPVVE